MNAAPNFEAALQSLEDALEALPLPPPGPAVAPALRKEYAEVALYILHAKERLALLHGMWAAQGAPQQQAEAAAKPLSRHRRKDRPMGSA
jgi:hypothetical protein